MNRLRSVRRTVAMAALLGLSLPTGLLRAMPANTAVKGARPSASTATESAPAPKSRRPKTSAQKAKGGGHRGLERVAESDLGVTENSSRANEMARKAGLSSSSGKGNSWCAAAVSDWLRKRGVDIHPTAAVSDLRRQLKGYPTASRPTPGAVVFYKHSHVGVVAEVLEDGSFYAIEGNYSNQVKRVHRPSNSARCFVML